VWDGYGDYDEIPMGLWGFHWDFRMDSKLRGNELNTAHFFVICFTGISLHYKLLSAHSNTVIKK